MGLTRGMKALIAFTACLPQFTSVSSHPLQGTTLQAIGPNKTLSSPLLFNNLPGTVPSTPPNIQLSIDHDLNKKLLALGMYLNALDAVITLGFSAWNAKPVGPQGLRVRSLGPRPWREGYDVEIDMENAQRPSDPLQLKTGYIVTGLWETMVQVSTENFYYATVLTLKQHYREIGTIIFKEPTTRATINVTTVGANPVPAPALLDTGAGPPPAVPVNVTAGPTYPAGRVADPIYGGATVLYTYTNTPINSKDILMAMLGLAAEAAQYPVRTQMQPMGQKSPSGRCYITLRPSPSPYTIEYVFITRMMRVLLGGVMLELEKFGEMTFQLEYHGYRVAEGYITALRPAPGVAAE